MDASFKIDGSAQSWNIITVTAAIPFRSVLAIFVSLVFGHLLAAVPAPAQPTPSNQLARIVIKGARFETQSGARFSPFGVNYYRPGTGWAPQLWKKFDADATRADFARMKDFGINCVRVFISYGSFCDARGGLKDEGLRKFDEFLAIAEQAGIYVHPTGPDHWEGPAPWGDTAVDDELNVSKLEEFWRRFAARYRGRSVIFAYDLKNEPEVRWDGSGMREKWNAWLTEKYNTSGRLEQAWAGTNRVALGQVPIPEPKDQLNSPSLLDYQEFRESLADAWTRRQAAAIKAADPDALVTVGMIQWSVPVVLPGLRHYAAFRPERQAKFLDFLEIHFYPLAQGAFEYRGSEDELANWSYLESVVREVAKPGKPVVLAEFGWYGGGKPKFDRGSHPLASQEQHAHYCKGVVEVSSPFVTGWLNWGFYDQPEATDCSELTGLLTAVGQTKAWGRVFADLSARLTRGGLTPASVGLRPELDWSRLLTSMQAEAEFRGKYLEAFKQSIKQN